MKLLPVLLLQIIFLSFLNAQQFNTHTVSLIPENRDVPYFNENAYRKAAFERNRSKFKLKFQLAKYADECTESAKELYNSSDIYSNLPQQTEYIKRVLKKTLPAKYQLDSVNVFIVRDPSLNAFCMEDGNIFIHIGLLSALENEAELAAVLSHEFGHHNKKHSLNRFKKRQKTTTAAVGVSIVGALMGVGQTPSDLVMSTIFKYDRKQEKESDFFAISFFKENGFAKQSIISAEKKFLAMEKKDENKIFYEEYPAIYRTHPPTSERITYLYDSLDAIAGDGKKFQVDSTAFLSLKKRATDESIYLLFSNGELDECLEISYKEHLKNPDDEFYLYFLLESLRRKTKIFPDFASKYFLTHRYLTDFLYDKNDKANNVSTLDNRHLTIHCNLYKIFGTEVFLTKSKSELLDDSLLEFKTNGEALEYFTSIAKTKCRACYPSLIRMGLPYTKPEESDLKNELAAQIYEQVFLSKMAQYTSEKKYCSIFYLNNYYVSSPKSDSYRTYFMSTGSSDYNNFVSDIKPATYLVSSPCEKLAAYPVLSYKDQNLAFSWIQDLTYAVNIQGSETKDEISYKSLFNEAVSVLESKLDLENDFPELNIMFKKYGVKKLFLADVLEEMPKQSFTSRPNAPPNYSTFIYYIDCSSGKVARFHFYLPHIKDISYNELYRPSYETLMDKVSEVIHKFSY